MDEPLFLFTFEKKGGSLEGRDMSYMDAPGSMETNVGKLTLLYFMYFVSWGIGNQFVLRWPNLTSISLSLFSQ